MPPDYAGHAQQSIYAMLNRVDGKSEFFNFYEVEQKLIGQGGALDTNLQETTRLISIWQ